MRKGSPADYTAEIGCSKQPTQKSRTGEPHECYSLYRIRRSQENYQLLRKDRRRPDCGGRHITSTAHSTTALGGRPATSLVWGHGSHPVQCLDLRHPETIRPTAFHGPSGHDEGHQRRQEEKRSHRCTHDCRPTALRSVTQVLCVTTRVTRSAASPTLSQPHRTTIGAHAEQDGRFADGERNRIQQGQTTGKEVLCQPHEDFAGSTGVGQRPAAYESWFYGDVRVHAEAAHQETACRTRLAAARRKVGEHWRGGPDHGSDLGFGSRRSAPLLLYRGCSQLLRVDGSLPLLCRQTAALSDFQAAQCLAADGTDRSGQAGAALESPTGGTARSATGARPRQPRHLASGAKTGSLPAGCGQERPALSATHSASAAHHYEVKKEKEKGSSFSASCLRENIAPGRDYALTTGTTKTDHATASFLRHADLSPDGHSRPVSTKGNLPSKTPLVTHRLDESGRVFLAGCSSAEPASASTHSGYQNLYVRSVSGPPAGPCVFGDCARELRLLLHTTVCFEAGRFTLTQSSWTAPARRCSRKWMSGHAATALVLPSDRGQFRTLTICSPGEPIPTGQGESPFPLDFYLSWTSPKRPRKGPQFVSCRVQRSRFGSIPE